jgi:urea transporter
LALCISGLWSVIFQGSVVVGILFFVAVLLNRPITAIYGLVASLLGASVAMYILLDEQSAAAGLGIQCRPMCHCICGQKGERWWALISVTISLVVTWIMMHFGLVQLTFPFVFSACLVTYIKNYFESRIKDASSA